MIKNFPFESEEKQVVWIYREGFISCGEDTIKIFSSREKGLKEVSDNGFIHHIIFSDDLYTNDNEERWADIRACEVE